jgi:hypothetical protein
MPWRCACSPTLVAGRPWGRVRELVSTPTVELTVHVRQGLGGPPPGPVLARFTSRVSREGYWDEDGELWSSDRRLLA